MNDVDLEAWISRHHIPEETALIIRRIRLSPPSRRVKDGRGNVTGRYPSQKMGQTIQFESHKDELAFIREYEFDENVLEYYDQPEPIKISYLSGSRKITTLTTADFFVIRKGGLAGWEECKLEKDLEKISEKSERFVRDEEGHWRCPPGENYAAAFGLYFRVRSSAEINWIWQRNINYLSDYIQSPSYTVPSEAESVITALVSLKQGILLEELIATAGTEFPDHIFQLITTGRLYVNLHLHPLNEHNRVPVYTSREFFFAPPLPTPSMETCPVIIQSGNKVALDGKIYKITNVGTRHVWLQNEEAETVSLCHDDMEKMVMIGAMKGIPLKSESNSLYELLIQKSPRAYEEATRKHETIAPYLSGDVTPPPSSAIYEWLKKYRDAEALYGHGYLGLLDRKSDRGNRCPKLPALTYELMKSTVKEQFLNPTQSSQASVYGNYCNKCKKANVVAASYKTFTGYIKNQDAVITERRRKGPRAAYQLEIFYWELEPTTPRHGERPFEIVHLDHTELDIELVDSTTGENFGRPWFTLMMDAYSRMCLAFVLSYEPPSYRSCMMVLRECVRIHNRLPQTIVVDRGTEFNSTYFEQFIALQNMTKKNRPSAKARFGAVMERLFGVTNQRFIHELVGNTKIMVNVRQTTKSVNPANLAVWTFPELRKRIGSYFSVVYEDLDHPALGETPRRAFERGKVIHGLRSMRLIRYDEAFILSTLPSTSKGYAKVIRSKGVKINNCYYWNEALQSLAGSNVPVRYDPYNIGTAYIFLKAHNTWVRCRSEYYVWLHGRTEKEILAISCEIRQRASMHHRKVIINAQKIAAFIAETQGLEAELKVMRRAAEMREPDGDAPGQQAVEYAPPTLTPEDVEIYGELL